MRMQQCCPSDKPFLMRYFHSFQTSKDCGFKFGPFALEGKMNFTAA